MLRAEVKSRVISNKTMIAVGLLVIPAELVILTAVNILWAVANPHPGFLGGLDVATRAAGILGILSSITVFAILIIGLNKEPGKKVAGAAVCTIVLALVMVQAIYCMSAWIKYG
jgi:hypothetical protein